jgi:hypothetical protein
MGDEGILKVIKRPHRSFSFFGLVEAASTASALFFDFRNGSDFFDPGRFVFPLPGLVVAPFLHAL